MTKISTLLLTPALLLLSATPTYAADAERNDRLYDAEGAKVAKVMRVADDGDVIIIYKGKARRIDASTLSNIDGKLVTTLSQKEIRRLR